MYKQFSTDNENFIFNIPNVNTTEMMSVLVVDDDLNMQELISVFLKDTYKMDVHLACNVSDALLYLKNSHIDLVICDYQMPGGDGLEVLDYLRVNTLFIPFVLFSGSLELDIPIIFPLVEVIGDKSLKKLLQVVRSQILSS